ncbi:unnamed protein product [Prorocentrum cordatum]|uniref:Protein kinase domain-containing protein n=1 Tax=Prorocentrum cordatum TaxID=2364126 RepID=A0ABN9UDU7_9DINO|nr:unnamed protein product [Polarella glacialis]
MCIVLFPLPPLPLFGSPPPREALVATAGLASKSWSERTPGEVPGGAARWASSRLPQDEGSFGRVQRCSDNLVRIGRAVKSIRIPSDPRQLVMLHREVEALVALDHPHIVRLIEYFEEGSELLLVMELLEGLSLGHRMRLEGRFGERLAAMCARHMLKALFCCHSHGIAHNDVSTENFKFLGQGPESALKMVDFGLSERFDAPAACHAMGAGGEQDSKYKHQHKHELSEFRPDLLDRRKFEHP